MTLKSFLQAAEFVTSVAVGLTVLSFSFSAYRRTKLRAFAFWIWSCTLSVILMTAWYFFTLYPVSSREHYFTSSVIYRILFMVDNVLGAIGSVMLIRHVLAERERKDKDVA